MGQDESTAGRKNCKSGPKKNKNKASTIPKNSIGPNNGHVGLNEVPKESPIKEGWASLHSGSISQDGTECVYLESDPKRKCEVLKTDPTEVTCMEKKLKLDEETRNLSILMATHLGSAEAAE